MLLAEANQWPEDAAAYFGDGDECHMNFHFPIMPRMFMAIHMEDRFPILDILAQTPQIPANCQWALFLRNHDELTLEMVTDEERDYMYRAYAHDSEMRINLGIRRRLAPLVGNDRRKMELLNGLLFSLPGTPVLYYGDEIGMGDNVFLGDRNGVRTPMQWSDDRNAGFSRANPQRLILPIIIDPEYHYEAINVEAQQNNPNSLLWWTKRLIALRKQFQAFGRGTHGVPHARPTTGCWPSCASSDDETMLVVANLSRFAQYVELDLSQVEGDAPASSWSGTRRVPAHRRAALPADAGRARLLLVLDRAAAAAPRPTGAGRRLRPAGAGRAQRARACSSATSGWCWRSAARRSCARRRWFRGRAFRVVAAHASTKRSPSARASSSDRRAVEYADHEAERYVLPLARRHRRPPAALARALVAALLRLPDGDVPLVDAAEERRVGARAARGDPRRARAAGRAAAPSWPRRSSSSRRRSTSSRATSAPSTRRPRSATATGTC